MKRTEANLFIQEMNGPGQDQKKRLLQILKTHPGHIKITFYWINIVNRFASDTLDQAPPSERSGILRALLPPIREKNRGHVLWELLEIYFGKEGEIIPAGVFIPSGFMHSVLKRFKTEDDCRRKRLLLEMLLLCSRSVTEGLTPEDCLIGLHHMDELFRCKILHFLYNHYREVPLSLILREVPLMKPPPSMLFYGTLTYFLRLHPEINWVEKIEAVIHSNSNPLANGSEKEGLKMLYEEMKMSAFRHQALSLDTGVNRTGQGRLKEREDAVHGMDLTRELTGIRLERFEKIGSKTDRR